MELNRLDYAILKILYSGQCRSFFKSMTLKEIMEHTGAARPTLARKMDKLKEWGYVEKGCMSTNANTFFLTEKGIKLIEGSEGK